MIGTRLQELRDRRPFRFRPEIDAVALVVCLFAGIATISAARATEPSGLTPSDERFWQSIATQDPSETTSLRRLFLFLRNLAEDRRHGERWGRVLELVAKAQDRDPRSPTYGNFRWLWRDAGVADPNAVEFLMQDAALAWLRGGDAMPESARAGLRTVLEHAVEACLRHRVPVTYTNVAILNAGNVAVLGEILDRPAAAEEGYRRLEAICRWTWAFGISEYCSPTYYGVDLDGLEFLLSFARRERARQQAAALRRLFWLDVAMNFFTPGEKLAGSHSRSYDYLRGIGTLDLQLAAAGWLHGGRRDRPSQRSPDRLANMLQLQEAARSQVPRVVRERWGMPLRQSRTHALFADVTLSCAASAYFYQDVPLTVDLPGDRNLPRCYFIADGREDPYGKARIEAGAAKHLKAIHLVPFWAAAQRSCDAVGLAIYRASDLKTATIANLQSHLVLRRPDGLWLAGTETRRMGLRPVPAADATLQPAPAANALLECAPERLPVEVGVPLVLRYGSAAVGIRLLWTRAQDGTPAPAALVDDANSFGVIRLTIEHRRATATAEAGAAIWIRVGSGLADSSAFEAWRRRFEQQTPTAVEASDRLVRLEVPGEAGPVSVTARSPFGQGGGVAYQPEPTRAVLEVDGKDLGRPILETVEPMRTECRQRNPLDPLEIPAQGSVSWEAEDGMILHGMTADDDPEASGGRYVVQPKAREVFQVPGSVTWSLRVAQAGRYHLWARVLAPDSGARSFHVLLEGDTDELPVRGPWLLREGAGWNWQRLTLGTQPAPITLDLPAGLVWLQIRPRETRTRIDRLFLTSDATEQPAK